MATWHLGIFILLNTNVILNAEVIHTSVANEYQNGIITCDGTEDCIVICDTDHACYNTDIHCPSNHSCTIQCTASWGGGNNNCAYADIYCPTNGQCDIICDGLGESNEGYGYSCYLAEFFWPTRFPFNTTYSLECNGGNACQAISIDAPSDDLAFNFECHGFNGCQYATLNCPKNAECNVTCDGHFSCDHLTINCPTNNHSSCNVICTGDVACNLAAINWPPNSSTAQSTITCDDQLYVNPCENTNFPPTLSPTNLPSTSVPTTRIPSFNPTTHIPTLNPSITPTKIPTETPTMIPTNIPTLNPTLNPTVNPSLIPTVTPSIIPTLIPTVNPTTMPTFPPTLIPIVLVSPTPIPTFYPSENPISPTIIPSFYPSFKMENTQSSMVSSLNDATQVNQSLSGSNKVQNIAEFIGISAFGIVFCTLMICLYIHVYRKKKRKYLQTQHVHVKETSISMIANRNNNSSFAMNLSNLNVGNTILMDDIITDVNKPQTILTPGDTDGFITDEDEDDDDDVMDDMELLEGVDEDETIILDEPTLKEGIKSQYSMDNILVNDIIGNDKIIKSDTTDFGNQMDHSFTISDDENEDDEYMYAIIENDDNIEIDFATTSKCEKNKKKQSVAELLGSDQTPNQPIVHHHNIPRKKKDTIGTENGEDVGKV